MINQVILKKMKIKEGEYVSPFLTEITLEDNILTNEKNNIILFEVLKLEDLETLKDLLNSDTDQMVWLIYVKPIHKDAILYRDHPFTPIASKGYETVAQISINSRYSTIRFRHLSYIKKLSRQDRNKITKDFK